MKANIRQISELTGFSAATISKALNGKKGIKKETSDAIFEAANQLGYRTETKASKIYLVIFQSSSSSPGNFFHNFILEGVDKQAHKAGLEITLILLDRNNSDFFKTIKEITHDINAYIILVGTGMSEEDYLLFNSAYNRIVIMDGWSKTCNFPSIAINNEAISQMAVSLLAKYGHKKSGDIRSILRLPNFQEREAGFRNALHNLGIPFRSDYIVDVPIPMEDACKCMNDYLMKHPDHPTAFLAENDFIAIGASRGIVQAGLCIPDDISIIGIDDTEYGRMEKPPLTTFQVHMATIGELAVTQLLSLPFDNMPKCKTLVFPDLIERGSVKNILT